MPSACAAMPMRPPSSARIAILKPVALGAEARVVADGAVGRGRPARLGAPRMPSLSSGGPIARPGVSIGTRKAVMPRLPLAGVGRRDSTIITSATGRVGDEVLGAVQHPAVAVAARRASSAPWRRSRPRARTARSSRASCPAARSGSQRARCASVPSLRIGAHTSEFCTDIATAVDAQARAISSSASA